MQKQPVLIVGMARSGTTLVSHVLGSLPGVHIEVEPHALWKSGNYKYFNDEEYDITDAIVNNIRTKLTKDLDGKMLIEKSPINSLRPGMVHAVFPDAKIVYIERDPIRCIYSNYSRSLKKDSFKLSIILKKYFLYTGSKDLDGAISDRGLFQQISLKDIPQFIKYTAKMFYLRRGKEALPFGPKLKNFIDIVKSKGLLEYHVLVYKKSLQYKQEFKKLYGDNMQVFTMENIMKSEDEIKRMIEFTGVEYNSDWGKQIMVTFDKERVEESGKERPVDKQIKQLLQQ